MLSKLKEDFIKLIKDFTNKIFNELEEETNNKLIELNKTIQDMNGQFGKELEITSRKQAEIQDMKNSAESTNSRFDQQGDRVSEIKNKVDIANDKLSDTLKLINIQAGSNICYSTQ